MDNHFWLVAIVFLGMAIGCPGSDPDDDDAADDDDADDDDADDDDAADDDTGDDDLCDDPVPVTVASPTGGVAPLAVFFDAVDIAGGVVQPVDGYHAGQLYQWDFGDPASGTWSTTGVSRDRAEGFVAGHVYEEPGQYTVTLRVIEADGTEHCYSQDVVADDPATAPGWTTYYVANDGSDSNDGTSEGTPLASYGEAMARVGPQVRILLRRGDSWSVFGDTWINSDGPGIIGAYGSGDPPRISVSASSVGFYFGWSAANDGWRFVDLELEGGGGDSIAFMAEGTVLSELLLLRLDLHDWGAGVVVSGDCDSFDHNAVVDCSITDISSNWAVYTGGHRSFVMGNTLSNPGVSHTVRNWCPDGFVLGHNDMGDAALHSLKMHSPDYGETGQVSRDIVITDNRFRPAGAWTVAIGPQNDQHDERVSNVVLERNVFESGMETQVALLIWAEDVTARNNLFIGDGASSYYTGVYVGQRGIEPPSSGTHVLANTIYRGDAGSEFTAILVDSAATDTTVHDNLAAAPGTPGASLIADSSSGLVESHNLLGGAADFVDPGVQNLVLAPGSAAIDAGLDVGLPYDHARQPRADDPQTTNTGSGALDYVDIGALEVQP